MVSRFMHIFGVEDTAFSPKLSGLYLQTVMTCLQLMGRSYYLTQIHQSFIIGSKSKQSQ